MRVIKVDEANFGKVYEAAAAAARDFLFLFWDITADRLPGGDFDRADQGSVDPYQYVDLEFDGAAVVDTELLRVGAAVTLLARLAEVNDLDECSETTYLRDFNAGRPQTGTGIPRVEELARIREVFDAGGIIEHPALIEAFEVAFSDPDRLRDALARVVREVILPTFELRFRSSA